MINFVCFCGKVMDFKKLLKNYVKELDEEFFFDLEKYLFIKQFREVVWVCFCIFNLGYGFDIIMKLGLMLEINFQVDMVRFWKDDGGGGYINLQCYL